MMTSKIVPVMVNNDAELVSASLAGQREAFGQIVSRYQSLVCSLAYSATGSLTASEDLAQETFVAAWKQLAALREPEKLRAWLCGIARNLINNFLRKQGREPSHRAESLEEVSESHSPEPLPAEKAISNEEAALLWSSLEKIPEIYREPIVLFYREHQSIETVAENLDLTEDAVKQRLSRGRKLLHEQMMVFVQGALARTNPGQVFTLGVMAALPAMSVSTKAATLGAAAKSSATAKGAVWLGLFGKALMPLGMFWGLWSTGRAEYKAARSDGERRFYKNYYIRLVVGIVLAVVICSVLIDHGGTLFKTKFGLLAMIMGLTLGYILFVGGFFIWRYRVRNKFPAADALAKASTNPGPAWEYRSRFQLFGLPFIHFRFGGWRAGPMKMQKPVKAWIAATDSFAFGVLFAYGGTAVAPISIGAVAIGLFSYGAVAAGVLAVGGFGFGIWAFGGLAFGWQVSAGAAVAWDIASGGQYAIAHHFALGPIAYAEQVNTDFVKHLVITSPFFRTCWMLLPHFFWLMWIWVIPMMASMIVQFWAAASQHRRTEHEILKDPL
jgi:RNA polymerase sigma factor (sigma-70 family)